MKNSMQYRGWYFLLSLILIAPGLILMTYWGITTGSPLPLSIDFTGGTLWEMRFEQPVEPAPVRDVFIDAGFSDTTVFNVRDDNTVQAKFKNIDTAEKGAIAAQLTERIGPFAELSYRSIGPAIGGEVSRAAILAVAAASALILIYLALAFRTVSHPIRYGVCAVASLLHDVLVTLSFISIMRLVAGWEINTLFLTAVLTVIGYSVNDTIVIFDRIRENLRRYRGETFTTIANRSIIETLPRTLATGVCTLLTLFAVLMLGGATLQQFMLTMIIGIISGSFSSIFDATALLVAWDEGSLLPRKGAPKVVDGNAALA